PVAASMSNMFAQTGTPTFAQPGNGHNNGFPPSPQWGHSANTYGFSPSQQWNNTMPASHGFSPSQQWNTMPGTPGFPPPQQWNTTPGPYGFSPAQQNGFSQNNLPPLQSGGSPFQQGNAPGVPGVPVPPVAQTGTFTSHRQVEFSPTTTGNQPAIQPPPHGSNTPEQSKTTTRPLPTSIRLRAMQRNSETVPTVPAKPE
ncbi:MAG TPA: hypothetical protein VEV19_00175, partial [Ktedonobacteraceae bacterium]|nr:hypothetical protein [Ktedonobacteraceae bacterium]